MADADQGKAFLDAKASGMPRVFAPNELRGRVEALWRAGLPAGDKTGWPSVDKHYTVVPGQLSIVTGWPGSGKSEWLDAMLVNLARQGWKIGMFSPENQPIELHLAKLLEKVSGKPFGDGPNERIAEDEVPEYLDDLSQSFAFLASPNGDAISAKLVIEALTPWLDQHKGCKRGLVIDPWNELEHWRPANLSETEYVSQTLSYVRGWARVNNIHVWIVAHPRNIRREDGSKLPVPRPDMISGSQHWWNKADCALAVYRDYDDETAPVQVHIQKVRFKHVGRLGAVELRYDRVTGRYHEIPNLREVSAYKRHSRGEDE
jgi:twinkle protein